MRLRVPDSCFQATHSISRYTCTITPGKCVNFSTGLNLLLPLDSATCKMCHNVRVLDYISAASLHFSWWTVEASFGPNMEPRPPVLAYPWKCYWRLAVKGILSAFLLNTQSVQYTVFRPSYDAQVQKQKFN